MLGVTAALLLSAAAASRDGAGPPSVRGRRQPSSPPPAACEVPAQLREHCGHNELLLAPAANQTHAAWLRAIRGWREGCAGAVGYNGSIYTQPALAWTQASYIQPQMHPYDKLFFNHTSGEYTVGVWLADLKARYGGVDAALVWPTYVVAPPQYACRAPRRGRVAVLRASPSWPGTALHCTAPPHMEEGGGSPPRFSFWLGRTLPQQHRVWNRHPRPP